MGGHGKDAPRSGSRPAIAAAIATVLILSVAACGGGESQDSNEPAGTYPVRVVAASFPTEQKLGETTLLRLGIRNTGDKTIPALTVNVSIAGKEGAGSTVPFAIRDPQPELAQPDRPVWVLAEHYPKFEGSASPGGAGTSNPRTFAFGAVKPNATADVVWKLSAVRSGRYTLTYAIDAGLSGEAKAETDGGVEPGGSFVVQISSAPVDKEVTDSGEVVEKSARASR